ncbi:histamine H2 receptor-like [Amphiura filiformis]|uniref:histamine H2 receptor-like n=1 Tax=Amphiura filiformis TaxID=82378 RepID=UPI003B217BDC
MIFAIVLIFLALATIVGNTFCLLVLRQKVDGISEVVSIFMKSLAAADLFTGIFTISPAVGPAITGNWPYSYTYCGINAFTQNLFGTCSIFSLIAVNVERYIAIVYPLHYTTLVTAVKARIVVINIWIFATGWAVLHVFRPGQVAKYHQGIKMCVADPIDPDDSDVTSVIWAMAFFAFPCVVTVCLYLRLYCISSAHARRIDADESVLRQVENNVVNRFRSVEFKTSVTFFILTLLLIATYIPVSVAIALEGSGAVTRRSREQLAGTVVALWMANSCINVVVYSVRNKSFRRRGRQLFGVPSIENGSSVRVPAITGHTG